MRSSVVPALALALPLSLAALSLAGVARAGDDRPEAEHKLTWRGEERTYLLHRPAKRDKTKPAPLVIMLHGGGGTAEGNVKLTRGGLDDRADKDGWLVAYPQGTERGWNDGRAGEGAMARRNRVDDVGFLSTMIDEIGAAENVDRARVYATGISNGAFMCHRLARELSGKIAAIAPVAGNLQLPEELATVPSRAVSVLAINGTKDPLVPYGGGEVKVLGFKRGKCLSVLDTIKWWVKVDGCSPESTYSEEPEETSDDGTLVRTAVHSGGRDESEVVLYTIVGGGHTWPGGLQYLPEAVIGKTCRHLDANDVIWKFFQKHAMK
jgi:polyhydroxybutyrate depolymerase